MGTGLPRYSGLPSSASASTAIAALPMGSVFWTGNAAATVITTQSTWTRVAPVAGTLATPTSGFDSPANARLRYTVTAAGRILLSVMVSLSGASPNDIYLIGIWKNGGVNGSNEFTSGAQVAGSSIHMKVGGAGDAISSAAICIDAAALNDYYELAIQNTSSTADPTIQDANLVGNGNPS